MKYSFSSIDCHGTVKLELFIGRWKCFNPFTPILSGKIGITVLTWPNLEQFYRLDV